MSSAEQKQKMTQKLLRNLKSKQTSSTRLQSSDVSSSKTEGTDKEFQKNHAADLTRRAVAEICRDTEKAAKPAAAIGPTAWKKRTIKTNKRFLTNTMRSVLNHNERTTSKHATRSKKRFEDLNKRKPKFGERMHSFQCSSERLTRKKRSNNDSR